MENTPEIPIRNTTNRPSWLKPMTEDERLAVAQKRIEDQEWAKEHLKQDWMDEGWMREIAHSVGLKLASWYYPASTTKYIRRALKAVGRDGVWHKEVFGFPIGEWGKVNPSHPAWVAQCLIVEQHLLDRGVL